MKFFLHIKTIAVSLFIGGILMSFMVVNPFNNMVSALKKGNVDELSHYFDNMVEITLPSNANSYSKSQAIVILKEFFANNSVKNFILIHKGNSGEGSSFGIGNLITEKGIYRTTFFFREKKNTFVIQELRFERKRE